MEKTRLSLLQRLRTLSGDSAWEEFDRIYSPVVIRFAQKKGLNNAAALDVLQETMVALMRQMPKFNYDSSRGRFRNFVLTIVHRKILDARRRAVRKAEVPLEASPGEEGLALIDRLPDTHQVDPGEALERDWRHALYEQALERVRHDPAVENHTLEAFHAYVIEDGDVVDVCQRFGLKRNALYQIKSRMIARLRDEVAILNREMDE